MAAADANVRITRKEGGDEGRDRLVNLNSRAYDARMLGILVYCERTGAWAAAVRRCLGACSLAQRETRSLAECREVLSEFPRSLVALEVTSHNLEQACEFLVMLSQHFPRARTVALLQRGLEQHQWVLRELGCLAVTNSPRELQPVADLAQRYITALPAPPMTWQEQIWSQLPWRPLTKDS